MERATTFWRKRAERAEALIEVQKTSRRYGDVAGHRALLMATVTEVGTWLGIAPTCAPLGMPRATYYRRRRSQSAPLRRRISPRALTDAERTVVLAMLHEPRFADLAPAEVYATLLDEGRYLCSERTMYRLLAAHDELRERRNQRRHPQYAAPELLAQQPNQLWSWDITKLLWAGEVDVFLAVCDARRLQPLRGRLDDRPSRERHAGRTVHSRNVRPPGHSAGPAHDPRRPRISNDLQACRAFAG